jgi:hypothetical protein
MQSSSDRVIECSQHAACSDSIVIVATLSIATGYVHDSSHTARWLSMDELDSS